MTTTMTDDKVAAIAYGFDNYIANLSTEQGIDVLSLTSILLARLVLINEYAGCGDDFRKILGEVSTERLPRGAAPGIH